MFGKKVVNDKVEYSHMSQEEQMDFDWKDILAFIIAFFQVLFPYVVGVIGTYFIVALLLSLWIR